jgi:hypothetical protein
MERPPALAFPAKVAIGDRDRANIDLIDLLLRAFTFLRR